MDILLINTKKIFDCIFQAKWVQDMKNFYINDNLIIWTKAFLVNILMKLVIDKFTNLKQKVKLDIL